MSSRMTDIYAVAAMIIDAFRIIAGISDKAFTYYQDE